MKTHLLFRLAAALLLVVSARAERPSSDQLAVEAGVTTWVAAWNVGDRAFDTKKLQPLYREDVITRDATDTKHSWIEYAAALRPFIGQFAKVTPGPVRELRTTLDGARAVTTFALNPRIWTKDGREQTRTTQVRFVWEKTNAFWRIAEQEVVCTLRPEVGPVAANR